MNKLGLLFQLRAEYSLTDFAVFGRCEEYEIKKNKPILLFFSMGATVSKLTQLGTRLL